MGLEAWGLQGEDQDQNASVFSPFREYMLRSLAKADIPVGFAGMHLPPEVSDVSHALPLVPSSAH